MNMTIPIVSLRTSSASATSSTPQQLLAASLAISLSNSSRKTNALRSISTLSLYSDKGLDIYAEITDLQEYYPFSAELEILSQHSNEIAARMMGVPSSSHRNHDHHRKHHHEEDDHQSHSLPPPDATHVQLNQRWGDDAVGSNNQGVNGGLNSSSAEKVGLVVELGAGSLSKTRHLLRGLANLLPQFEADGRASDGAAFASIDYTALDLEHKSLVATLSDLVTQESNVVALANDPCVGKVSVGGLCATYDEGLEYLRRSSSPSFSTNDASSADSSSNGDNRSSRATSPTRTTGSKEGGEGGASLSAGSEGIDNNDGSSSSSAHSSSLMSSSTSSLSSSSFPSSASASSPSAAKEARRSLLWLGSSIGNFSRSAAAEFLSLLCTSSLSGAAGSTILIGIDNCSEAAKVGAAYDDAEGVTRRFILEGITQSGLALGEGGKRLAVGVEKGEWGYVSLWNEAEGRHEAYVRCLVEGVEVTLPSVDGAAAEVVKFEKDELIAIEVSVKYTHLEAYAVFKAAGLRLIQKWSDSKSLHTLYLLEKAPLNFATTLPLLIQDKEDSAAAVNHFGLPSLEDWQQMWKAWDLFTLQLLPRSLLFTKPIELRHMFLFYLGHIPAFCDIHLAKHLREELTEPKGFATLFERGIDPDVNDPSKINHSHSIVPTQNEDWPSLESILDYGAKVRQRLKDATTGPMTRRLARVLAMLIEHEAMHLETLLYIALQCPSPTPLHAPPGFALPDFPSLARGWNAQVAADGPEERKRILVFDSREIVIGVDDDDEDREEVEWDEAHVVAWDVEHPSRTVNVAAFEIDALPICNADYLTFLQSFGDQPRHDLFPSSWRYVGSSTMSATADGAQIGAESNTKRIEASDVRVKTLYGDVDFNVAQWWSTCASLDQFNAFAASHSARLPTESEYRVFVEAHPTDTPAANIGFMNLHPIPATLPVLVRVKPVEGQSVVGESSDEKNALDSQGRIGGGGRFGSNGGVWEWTTSVLEAHDGFSSSRLYPGYSSDFHDNAHFKILGGSYLTPPRIAGRSSFVNWYQAAYPYVVCGARLVRS